MADSHTESTGPQVYVLPPGGVPDVAGFDMSWCPADQRNFLNELVGIEAVSIDEEKEGLSWKYRPYPISRFGYIIRRIIEKSRTRPQRFLEVGCGVGTKLVLVQKMFGISAVGIDIFPEYIEASNSLIAAHNVRASAIEADATTFAYYGGYDIIFTNSPLWSWDHEYLLELKIMHEMSGGAVLMLGNAKVRSPGWPVLAEEIALTAYEKPKQ